MEPVRQSRERLGEAGKVFVGGPIQYAQGRAGDFEPGLRQKIETVVCALQEAGLDVLSAHEEERFGEVDLTGQSDFIVKRDIRWMRSCDLFVSVLPLGQNGRSYRSDGTCIELGWASSLDKPIIVIMSRDAEYSHLVLGLHAMAKVRYLDETEVFDDPAALVAEALRLIAHAAPAVGA